MHASFNHYRFQRGIEKNFNELHTRPIIITKSSIFVADRLTKYDHFATLAHPFTTSMAARVFLENICKLHSLSHSIAIDRDHIFLG